MDKPKIRVMVAVDGVIQELFPDIISLSEICIIDGCDARVVTCVFGEKIVNYVKLVHGVSLRANEETVFPGAVLLIQDV